MNSNRYFGIRMPFAFDQGQVQGLAGFVFECMGCEFAVCSLQYTRADFFYQRLGTTSVFNEVGNGANFEAVLCCKNLQIWKPCHGAIVFHDFANHRRWAAASHGAQVATSFCMTGAH